MADLIIECNIREDEKYIIMIIERNDGFGFYSGGEKPIVKSARKAREFNTRRETNTFIRNNRILIETQWLNKDINSVNTNNK